MATIVSVFDFIPLAEQAAIVNRTSAYDSTNDLRNAIVSVGGSGQTLRFVGGTYNVSTLEFAGSDYAVDTSAGVTFQQVPGIIDEPVLSMVGVHNVTIGDLNVVGNLGTAGDVPPDGNPHESNHAAQMGSTTAVRIGHIFATNIRGDGLYVGGRTVPTTAGVYDLEVASISGTNVYRNLVTVAGGEVRIGAIINAGPVGYRDFDVEPNDAPDYQPTDLQIGYAKIGSCQITSATEEVSANAVRIGIFDADLDRVQSTTPAYPVEPGSGAFALGVDRVESVQIGHFKARNYNLYPLSLGIDWSVIDIGTFDVADCSLTDTTYNAMIVQHGSATGGFVRIGTLKCNANPNQFLARVQNDGVLKIKVQNIAYLNCMLGTSLTGRFANGIIDLDGVTGNALYFSSDIILENLSVVNGGSASLLYQCTNVVFINTDVSISALDANGSSNVTTINSSVNGSARDGVNFMLGGSLRVSGTKVVGAQQPAIPDANSGSVLSTLNTLLVSLRSHGLIAS
jgi:hypothetical protein